VVLATLRAAGNAFAFTVLTFAAVSLYPVNPFYTFLLLVVAYDQLEDILGLQPAGVLRYLDVPYELTCLGIGVIMTMFGITYYNYFYAPFHLMLVAAGFMVVASSIYDILQDMGVVAAQTMCFWVRDGGVLGSRWERQ